MKQIAKFEKLIEQFCDTIGMDKFSLMTGLTKRKQQADRSESQASETIQRTLDTGAAAVIAYTNLGPKEDPTNWKLSPQTRNIQNLHNTDTDRSGTPLMPIKGANLLNQGNLSAKVVQPLDARQGNHSAKNQHALKDNRGTKSQASLNTQH